MSDSTYHTYISSGTSTAIEHIRRCLLSIGMPKPLVPFEPIKVAEFRSFYEHRLRCKQFSGHKFDVGGSKK